MDMGIFLPNLSNGWLITTAAPPFESDYDNVLKVVQTCEEWGLEFALAPVKLRGFGGPSEFWDHAPEPITMMAGIAAQTSKIRLFASVATLTVPPALTARMVATLDQISKGRFGLNIVSGWQPAEYEQMGVWPGEAYFGDRYAYCGEYVTILRELWETRTFRFPGPLVHHEGLPAQPASEEPHQCGLCRPEREGPRLLRAVRRLHVCAGCRHQHADRACDDDQSVACRRPAHRTQDRNLLWR